MRGLLLGATSSLALATLSQAASATPIDFTFTGSLVTFTVPTTDAYQILAYGAQGGNATLGSFRRRRRSRRRDRRQFQPDRRRESCRLPSAARAGLVVAVAVLWSARATRRWSLPAAGGGAGLAACSTQGPLPGGGGLTGPDGGGHLVAPTAMAVAALPAMPGAAGGGGGGGFFSAGGNAPRRRHRGWCIPRSRRRVRFGGGFGGGGGGAGAVGFGGSGGGGGYSGGGGGGRTEGGHGPGGGGGSFDAGTDQILDGRFPCRQRRSGDNRTRPGGARARPLSRCLVRELISLAAVRRRIGERCRSAKNSN